MQPCINPSLIRQYLYCPMAAYYTATGAPEPPTLRMQKGRELQQEAAQAAAKALGAQKAEYAVHIAAPPLCGTVDAVLWINGRPSPLEVKAAARPRRIPIHHKAQAAAYTAMVQKRYGKAVTTAYIYYAESGHIAHIHITKDLQELLNYAVSRLQQILQGKPPVLNPNPAKCQNCWYRKWCSHLPTTVEKI
ncbi:CRISPR-associated protein Cas4 [Pyrobaculum neutrophilum]|uniref:CRISPR-associated exonuclease Cas4 n=1 Tax=Pyrobaculum neutrophilum (strain DSM 2338 / JCM 9278 / NBRC 100436 / V24Sta) TaxID=444157 RepID=B1YE59_PYRNV|nr:CRISPR-associated protein Cas4 [Pyrobaculum neutrophilum]ACB40072.1 CRISPR-associated protein Cas4 [Pyrobaculum neutrophilum V24Sta]